MSTMAEVISEHCPTYRMKANRLVWACTSRKCAIAAEQTYTEACEHVAAELAAAGYGNLADAWDEGHGIGCVDQILTVANGEQCDTPNPYRGADHE